MLWNPFAGYRVTDKWRAGHEAIDYGMDEWTAFGSPADGIYRHDGVFVDAGLRGSLHLINGGEIRFAHLADHIAAHGARVALGGSLAYSGNSGLSTGPHMHTYGMVHGARWNWTADATPQPPASPKPTPLLPTEIDMTQRVTLIRTKTTNGVYDGDWTLETPNDGLDLPAFDGTNAATAGRVIHNDARGRVVQFRGFRATSAPIIGEQWRRMFGYPSGLPHARLAREEYIAAQVQLSALARDS